MAVAVEAEEVIATVYNQCNVFVHTSVPASTHYDNIIRGNLKILEKADGAYIDWTPDKDLPSDMEFEVQSYLSGDYEWGVVSTQPSNQDIPNGEELKAVREKYRIHFKVTKLHSMRRSDPKLAWPYAIFILKDGTTQPALHFHSGGITALISHLQRYIWLTRPDWDLLSSAIKALGAKPTTDPSNRFCYVWFINDRKFEMTSTNQKLFVVEDVSDALGKPVSQIQLFNEQPADPISKFLNQASGTLHQFSKVTRLLMDTIGQPGPVGLEEHRPVSPAVNNDNRTRTTSEGDHEFEILHEGEPDLGPSIPVKRGQRLQPEEWCAFMDNDGRIKDHERLRERIFRGGIHEDIRREAWKFLLGYYDYESTYEERVKQKEAKSEEYFSMKRQWQTMTPGQTKRFTEFASRKHLVDKDSMRTDRTHPFFKAEHNENTQKLFDILMTYCMYNFDLGYVQGMSDLLSPILILMEDEVDSFWCFCGLMEKEAQNFEVMQHFMQTQLSNLGTLIKFYYPQFHQYLETKESGNLFFCFRWLLLTFKREFTFEHTMLLWEVLWTQKLTPYFKLFVALAILEGEKDHMMSSHFGFNEILKHINELSYKIDLPMILERTESLLLQSQQSNIIPEEVAHLIQYPAAETRVEITINDSKHENHEIVMATDEDENEAHDISGSASCNITPVHLPMTADVRMESIQKTSDEVVELCENTKSVF